MGKYGLTEGTRHYVQYQLTDPEGVDLQTGWQDLLYVDPTTSNMHGLWCSRSYSRANARIEELMAECSTTREQYRIVKRTWSEKILQHDPNWGKPAASIYAAEQDGVFQLVVSTYDLEETKSDLSEVAVEFTELEPTDAEGKTKIRITGTREAVLVAANELSVDVGLVKPFDSDAQDPTDEAYTSTDENPEQ